MKIVNPLTGNEHEIILDADGNPVSYVETQKIASDVFDIPRDMNYKNDISNRPNTQKHWRHIARIPATIRAELERQGITKDPVRYARWIEENYHFLIHHRGV